MTTDKKALRWRFPSGHFYSPIPDQDEAFAAVSRAVASTRQICGIGLDEFLMLDFWSDLSKWMAKAPFSETQSNRYRFYYQNDFYPYGDALVYFSMICRFRPARNHRIGSGFTSALALDAKDWLKSEIELTFIDPNPSMLYSLLRPDDDRSVTIIQSKVQNLDPTIFDRLQGNDFLFIDSSHVLKTGSDVCFELFDILPRLKPGVFVHFHDVFWPFEYPIDWLREGLAWNELYALRAFLMFNQSYKIKLFNHLFALRFPEKLREANILPGKNPGGSLWLQRNY